MTDRDYYGLAITIIGLALIGVAHARMLARHDDDIRFLMDHSVTTTEVS